MGGFRCVQLVDDTLEGLSSAEIEAIMEDTYEDPVAFMRFFLAHLFPTDMPWFHRGIVAILTGKTSFLPRYGDLARIALNFVTEIPEGSSEKPEPLFHIFVDGERWIPKDAQDHEPPGCVEVEIHKKQCTLIMVPRGFSKTTLCGIGVPVYNICFQEEPMTAYISETGPHAKMQLDNVKREIAQNERLRAVFGDLKPRLRDDEKWTADMFETSTGMSMVARGRGAQVRGMNHRGQRPRTIIVDDLEDRESVNTDEQRMKTRTWAYGDLMPAKADLHEDSTIIALGTLLHKEALLMYWAADPDWTVVKFGCRDKQGEWLWPALMDEERYTKKKQSFTNAGMLHVFYMEYENQYRSPETALVREDMIKVEIPAEDVIATSIYIDPAISDKPDADRTCIVVASMTSKGRIRIRDRWYKRGAHPREQIDQFFHMAKIHKPQKHGVETVAFQRALVHLMEEEMARQHYFFEVVKVTNTTAKDERIRGVLAPRFAAGYVTFDYPMADIVTELLDYPAGKVDGPDAMAGALALLDSYSAVPYHEEPEEDTYEPLSLLLGMDEGRWAH